MKKGEFGFIGDIATLFGSLPHHGFEPIGDDCTVVPIGDEALVMTTDMLVEDVHFLRGASSAQEVGQKSLYVNLSDVAAMGATPIATLLSIALPESAQGEWAEEFMRGYHTVAEREGVALVGGDTTASRDKITINVVAIGRANKQNIKRRSRAKVGDAICVTGKLGASSKGLVDIMFGDLNTQAAKAHRVAQARIKEGVWLGTRSEVHAMMDVSDGVASDLKHILNSSELGAEVELDKIPISEELAAVCKTNGWDALSLALEGGEDYCLLFTASTDISAEIMARTSSKIYCIGRLTDKCKDIKWIRDNEIQERNFRGFTHF